MRKYLGTLFIILTVMMFGGCLMILGGIAEQFQMQKVKLSEPSILVLKLEGIILDPTEFLEDLNKYSKESDIKGVLIQINSPGGVVGPSQELFSEIHRVSQELKKPVVVSVQSLAASGAYYAAVGADKIFVNPGSLVGSIGVIMEFANLEKLYDWAKIQRFTIKTGAYKDSGAEFREMRDDEKMMFQQMANEVLDQFKSTVKTQRKMTDQQINQIADGRVFTGAKALELGMVDTIGSYQDARKFIGQLAGIGEDPEMFEPPPKHPEFLKELFSEVRSRASIESVVKDLMNQNLWGQPLLVMPRALHYEKK